MPRPHPTLVARRLSGVVAVLLVLATVPGLAGGGVYRDNLLVASGWRGNDLVTLGLALPVLLVSIALAGRGSARARLVWLGMLLYVLYGYAFYLFGAAYNALFLVYAALVTLSLFALIFGLAGLDPAGPAARYPTATAHRWVAAWLAVLALALGSVHVGPALAYVATGRLPAIVTATGHPTNVVAALDLTLVVAPSLLAARWLLAGEPWGVVLATLVNAKGAVYMPALIAATLAAARAGAPVDPRQALVWAAIGLGCFAALGALLAGVRAPDGGPPAG